MGLSSSTAKAVPLPHRGRLEIARNTRESLHYGRDDNILATASNLIKEIKKYKKVFERHGVLKISAKA